MLTRGRSFAAVTALVLVLGVAYALMSTPIYQSNLLIQVEDAAPDAKGFLGESLRVASSTRTFCPSVAVGVQSRHRLVEVMTIHSRYFRRPNHARGCVKTLGSKIGNDQILGRRPELLSLGDITRHEIH